MANVASKFRFEMFDAAAGRWSADLCGQQDDSNYPETREAAEAELPNLASVLGCDVSALRVVEVQS